MNGVRFVGIGEKKVREWNPVGGRCFTARYPTSVTARMNRTGVRRDQYPQGPYTPGNCRVLGQGMSARKRFVTLL